jgi:putative ABC transport system permease protein
MSISSPASLTQAAPSGRGRESFVISGARAVWEALGGLVRAPRYSLPAILSLALGLGASMAVFAVFSALMLRPLPFPEEERLVRVGFPGASPVLAPEELSLSAPFLRDYQKLGSIFEQVSTERSWTGRLEFGGRVVRVGPQLVSINFFDTLGIQALEGRLFTARGPAPDGLDVMVLREGFWREKLGGAPLVGETVRYDGRPVRVLGILRDDQAIPSYMDLWVPENQASQIRRTQFWGRGIARLAPGVSLETAQARLTEASKDAGVRTPDGTPVSARLVPLRDSLVQPQRAWVALMLAAVGAFLLLAVANLAALLATRTTARAHEWAVRRALGANAFALARRSALDAGLVGVAGAGLGLLLANFAVEFANQAYLGSLGNTPARLDARVLVAGAAAALLCTLVGALAPVLSLRRVHPADALRGEGRSTDTLRARRLREALLVIQVAVTTVLLISAGLIVRSVRSLLAVDTGFESREVVTAGLLLPLEPLQQSPDPNLMQQAWQQRSDHVLGQARAALERVRRMPGAEHATVAIDVPFDYASWPTRLALSPGAAQQELTAFAHYVGPGFFETLGIPLLSGSDFGTALVADERPIAVVSRAFAHALGTPDAVGQRFRWALSGPDEAASEPWIAIVGMVEDSIENDLTAPPTPQVYFPFAAGALSVAGPTGVSFQVAVRGSDPDVLARELPRALGEALPQSATYDVRRMEEWVAESFWQRTALSRVLSALALAAVVLSAIGLFGITSFAVAQRTGEVGIRRALGATRRAVVGLVLRETARVVCVGVALGAVLSWFARQLLGTFLFGVSALDALTYGAVCLGIALVALLSALAPALGASRVSPSRALTGQ